MYTEKDEKKVLDDLILLDPTWLMKVMRNIMELKPGFGTSIANTDVIELEKMAIAKTSVLQECWKDFNLSEDNFHKLTLILQSFCLLFPLSFGHGNSRKKCQSTTTADNSSGLESKSTSTATSTLSSNTLKEDERQDRTYLIPSMLPPTDLNEHELQDIRKNMYKFSFDFEFENFLPVEVYHRLLCLMLKDRDCKKTQSQDKFLANYFRLSKVKKGRNWMVQMKGNKLIVSVTYPEE